MSLRTFTVFQDTVSSDALEPKISRPVTRSSSLNVASSSHATTLGDLGALDKENYHPVTGERAGPSNVGSKKRKTTALATKVQPSPTTKKEKDISAEPDQKKRKALSATKSKSKKEVKGSGSKKSGTKRAGSRKVSPMPRLNEEEEVEKDRITQSDIDSRCYELTVKPLADVSEAYEQASVFGEPVAAADTTSEDKVKFRAVKAASVEPEIRDYFQPSQALFRSTTTRTRALSEDLPEPRTFSTPERKQIYAAFTFSSPCASSTRMSKASCSGSISPAEPEML